MGGVRRGRSAHVEHLIDDALLDHPPPGRLADLTEQLLDVKSPVPARSNIRCRKPYCPPPSEPRDPALTACSVDGGSPALVTRAGDIIQSLDERWQPR